MEGTIQEKKDSGDKRGERTYLYAYCSNKTGKTAVYDVKEISNSFIFAKKGLKKIICYLDYIEKAL